MSFNWHSIRALNGSQNNGFEELCCQFARIESPSNSKFIRKGTPDGGVECYCILDDGKEWGWQAKYFDNFGDSQWNQLDESVKNAIDKHPQLAKYYICIPLDRPDARIDKQKSAKQKWDERVIKWTQWANDKDMNVEFVYWGSSELLKCLMLPQNTGKQRFWFESVGFDKGWFEQRLELAIKTAGPRYTPEIHVDLPIAKSFENFGRTIELFKTAKIFLKDLRSKISSFEHSIRKIDENILNDPLKNFNENLQITEKLFEEIAYQPIGELLFGQIVSQIDSCLKSNTVIEEILHKCDQEQRKNNPKKDYSYSKTSCGDALNNLRALRYELQKIESSLKDLDACASSSLLILQGSAGTGKTHLLCDVAKHRINQNQPTILLMGHQFTTSESPWNQARLHLDLPPMTLEEFVGALESSAQASDCRVLILIDAINEGSGREFWPVHLASFLTAIKRSPWIGVVISIRSSYINIIPKEILDDGYLLTHNGFEDTEYDAVKTFFTHYGIELPSSPLLTQEFQNPLFLKTLCSGLKESGERRLPRGLHGITAIFELYLSAINKKLSHSQELDYRESKRLVQNAMQSLAEKMVEHDSRWIDIDIAEEAINSLLPGRSYETSLYRKLLTMGIIGEEMVWHLNDEKREVVYFGYERLADHLIARYLLDSHLELSDPKSCFKKDGGLYFLLDSKHKNETGLVEALCIQIPERTKCELISIAPQFLKYWGIQSAYFSSIVWRSYEAFTEDTRTIFNKLIRNDYQLQEALDALLIVAIIPTHPFNAMFLDNRLHKDSMSERDSWWSIYLHKSWVHKGSVYRIVDWSLTLSDNSIVEDDVIELASITLTWFLSSSNRYLRDRATKSLVNILVGKFTLIQKLIDRFATINDLYIAERLYAAIYGVAMKTTNGKDLLQLAQCVYKHIFANGNPPVHILLRDYARGIIERALYLKADISIDTKLIRPPYGSMWPKIPSEEEIKPYLPDWSRGSHDSGEGEWSHNRIGSSIMSDDFARYVIGTNSWSSDFLSLKLNEPVWQSPEQQLEQLIEDFSSKEVKAWETFRLVDTKYRSIKNEKFFLQFTVDDFYDEDESEIVTDKSVDNELEEAKNERDVAYENLKEHLTKNHINTLDNIMELQSSDKQRPPKFDLKLIQRYVLWRVFDLGWTTEKFGEFDRFTIGYHGRDAAKAERIGKKYQWIAYHEIMAYIADNFQMKQEFRATENCNNYCGPWQIGLRDIDPSVTLLSTVGGSSWEAHHASWWCEETFNKWNREMSPKDWISNSTGTIPDIEKLLCVTDPNKVSWLNIHGFFNWKMPKDLNDETERTEHREIWYILNAYLIHNQDVDKFLEWAKNVNFFGRYMPEPQEYYEQFFGEHGWSPAAIHHRDPYFNYSGWVNPEKDCPVKLHIASSKYTGESSGFDCSIDEGFSVYCPNEELISLLELNWNGRDAEFIDQEGNLSVFDPTVRLNGPSSLLVRKDLIEKLNQNQQMTLCWKLIGEKRVFETKLSSQINYTDCISGAYVLKNGQIEGFYKTNLESFDEENG